MNVGNKVLFPVAEEEETIVGGDRIEAVVILNLD